MRQMGEILLDLETILTEMVDGHDLQFGDVLGLVHSYLVIHHPTAQEVYCEDDSSPVYYYGPKCSSK